MIQQILAIQSLVPLPFLKPAWTSGSSWFMDWWRLAWRILGITLLECEAKWTLGSIPMNRASGGDGTPVELFLILKDDAVKVLHSIRQHIWKIRQWPQDWKSKFALQSQRRAMTKSVQTTVQLHSFHTLTRSCSKFSKPGFNSMWTMNFQMFKLDLEKAEEPEIELSTSAESSESKSVPETHLLLLYWLPKHLTVWTIANCEKFFRRWV